MSIKLLHEQIITKTGNDHKQPQATTNDRKSPRTTSKRLQTTANQPANDRKLPQTVSNH